MGVLDPLVSVALGVVLPELCPVEALGGEVRCPLGGAALALEPPTVPEDRLMIIRKSSKRSIKLLQADEILEREQSTLTLRGPSYEGLLWSFSVAPACP